MRKTFVLTLILVIAVLATSQAVPDIATLGSWASIVISSADLSAGAGSALNSVYESGVTDVTLSITNTLDGTYNVTVKRTDTTWDTSVVLSVKRTGDGIAAGSGVGSIVNGLAYVPVGTVDAAFFNGTEDRTDIPVQFQLSNVSLNVAPNIYSTTITFTVAP